MKTTLYNMQQRVFALNWFSNMAGNKFGTASSLQQELTQNLEKIFKDPTFINLIGEWTLEWGPVVVEKGWDDTKKYHVATNTMFVAKQKQYNGVNDHYVIAIAGTNAISPYGWFVEDFKTNEMVLWAEAGMPAGPMGETCPVSSNNPSAPRVSKGTCTGLTTLLEMEWQPGTNTKTFLFSKKTPNGHSQTVFQFLQEKFSGTNAPADLLTVTGHSLGGALSSALALRLAETQWDSQKTGKGEFWNPSHSVNLTAMPTAGASPGNKAFSEYYGNTMGLRTNRIWNKMDPVPYGHEPAMLRYLPQLYYPYIVPDLGVYGFADYLLANSLLGTRLTCKEGGYYTQLMPQTAGMSGQFNNLFTPIPQGLVLKFCADFIYSKILELMGVPADLIKRIIAIINDIIKVEGWLGLQGELLAAVYKALMHVPGLEKLVDAVMKALHFLMNNVSALFAFLQQLGYQHVWAYPDLLGMTGFHEAMKGYLNSEKPHDDFEKLMVYAHDYLQKVWHNIFTKEMLIKEGIIGA